MIDERKMYISVPIFHSWVCGEGGGGGGGGRGRVFTIS